MRCCAPKERKSLKLYVECLVMYVGAGGETTRETEIGCTATEEGAAEHQDAL